MVNDSDSNDQRDVTKSIVRREMFAFRLDLHPNLTDLGLYENPLYSVEFELVENSFRFSSNFVLCVIF